MRQSLLADVLVTGSNAISKKKEVVSVDCSASYAIRVGSDYFF
ncbi:hypothetical protein [Caldicellulosiruptor hydrothermalis]|nr:hypothetical protein [Caldicellulosiruptor hydrothermalis]